MAWIFYLVALILWSGFNQLDAALIALAVGMLFHWKAWGIGLIAFFVGVGWTDWIKNIFKF